VSDSEIQNLEWRVVEAAVRQGLVRKRCSTAWRWNPTVPFTEEQKAKSELDSAVDALIVARDQAERKEYRLTCRHCGNSIRSFYPNDNNCHMCVSFGHSEEGACPLCVERKEVIDACNKTV